MKREQIQPGKCYQGSAGTKPRAVRRLYEPAFSSVDRAWVEYAIPLRFGSEAIRTCTLTKFARWAKHEQGTA
jgi:hypothetical protein